MGDDKLDRLTELIQELAVQVERLRGLLEGMAKVSEDHEQRLRSLDRWRNQLTPILAVLTFLLGSVISVAIERVW